MKHKRRIGDLPVPASILRILAAPPLRRPSFICAVRIFSNFFFLQSRAARNPGLIPVTQVDHALDEKIPFIPRRVDIYLDFVGFWIRSLGFLLKRRGRAAREAVRDFIESMGELYIFAAGVYRKNMSTTRRPLYLLHPRFVLIHLSDPHLMCIPSLHVMVVIRTYTKFAELAKSLGENLDDEIKELREGALKITEAILYVKQHSVNCIPAALYAMSSFSPELFPQEEAESFAGDLLRGERVPSARDGEAIRKHIVTLYRDFLAAGRDAPSWEYPLLAFLKDYAGKAPPGPPKGRPCGAAGR
jgi:hypothetical protein